MRATVSDVKLSMSLAGYPGDCNASELALGFLGMDVVLNGAESWDVAGLPWERFRSVLLAIPSGHLYSKEAKAVISADFKEISFHGDRGIWDGKQAGLLGGMSGYANFSCQVLTVERGTYMLPEDMPGACAARELDYSDDGYDLHYVPWPVYRSRYSRAIALRGRADAHAGAEAAAKILAIPVADRSEAEVCRLRGWHTGIRWLMGIEVENGNFSKLCAREECKRSAVEEFREMPADIAQIVGRVEGDGLKWHVVTYWEGAEERNDFYYLILEKESKERFFVSRDSFGSSEIQAIENFLVSDRRERRRARQERRRQGIEYEDPADGEVEDYEIVSEEEFEAED